jgi:hypothetical protein
MKQIVCIFRKDARHLWPQILAFVALALLAALLDPTYTLRHLSATEQLIWTALPLACWNLVIAAIHTERLPGDRQYWLTRPFSRRGLVAAKAFFVFAFVNLPLLLIQVGVLAFLGIPPFQHWSTLLWRQVFFTAFLVLPAAVLGAVTRNLKQAILAVLVVIVPLFLVEIAPFIFRAFSQISLLLIQIWNGDLWIRTLYLALYAATACLLILWLQYWRRTTVLSRTLIAAGLAGCVAVSALATQERAIALQELLSRSPSDSRAFRISAGPGSAVALLKSNGRMGLRIRLEIPAHLDAVPRGMEFLSVGLAGSIQGVPVEGGELADTVAAPVLAVYLTREDFARLKSAPADLQGSVDLTLFEPVQSMPPPKAEPVAVPGVGACRTRPDSDGHLSILCLSPFPRAALAIEFPGGGRHRIVTRRSADTPLPTSAGFTPIETFMSPASFESWDELGRMRLIVERQVATIRRTFDFRGIRLPKTPDDGRRYPGGPR